MSIGEKIREQRRKKNINQSELGDLVGISLKTVQRWETGERSPNTSIMAKLAEALGTTVGVLMGETPEPEAAPKNSGQNLPINNTPETVNNQSENLGLGYWGSVADNARKVAAKGNAQEKAAVLMMLKMATEAITGAESMPIAEKRGANILHADIIDNSGNVKQTISTAT